MNVVENDKAQVEEVIERYRQGFLTLDLEELKGIWDRDHNQILYIAQEMARPIQSWRGVEQYYQGTVKLLGRARKMEIRDLSVDVLGEVASLSKWKLAGD